MKELIVIGTGNQSKVVTDLIEQIGEYTIVGYYGYEKKLGEKVYGKEIICNETNRSRLKEIPYAFIAIGNGYYRELINKIILTANPHIHYPKLIHPFTSIHPNVSIGDGTIVMPGSVVNVGCEIGQHVLINTKVSIDHDCRLGNYASIAPGVTIGGNVAIENSAWIGLGSSIIQECTIGTHTVVGAGAVVVGNMPSYSVAYGVPCRVQHVRKESDSYL